jgi:hypothetical protein
MFGQQQAFQAKLQLGEFHHALFHGTAEEWLKQNFPGATFGIEEEVIRRQLAVVTFSDGSSLRWELTIG